MNRSNKSNISSRLRNCAPSNCPFFLPVLHPPPPPPPRKQSN
ncbi:hypothetical protein [Enterococcus hirae]|nr:hypothetical protein [Enterococcus hirae]